MTETKDIYRGHFAVGAFTHYLGFSVDCAGTHLHQVLIHSQLSLQVRLGSVVASVFGIGQVHLATLDV